MTYGLERGAHLVIDRRITIFSLVIFLLFAGIISRLFWLQVVQHEFYLDQSNRQNFASTEATAKRGEIFARDNTNSDKVDLYPLAANKVFYEVYVDPSKITRPQNTADALASALVLNSADLLPRVSKTNDIYEPIAHKVTAEQLAAVKQINLPGIFSREEIWRYYPDKEVGSHVLGFYGYNDQQKIGKYGIEGYWNKELSGSGTAKVTSFTGSGDTAQASADGLNQTSDGADVVLTLDRTIQYETCRALDRAVVTYGAENGSAIVMEPASGRILALCNAPGFDPNRYQEVADVSYFNNNALYEAYEPGSIFKVLAMSAALDSKKVTPATVYEDKGVVKFGDFEVKNFDKKAHGVQTMTQALENSLNLGLIFATREVPNEVFRDYVKNFGFGQKYDIGLDQQVSGDISSLDRKGEIYKATASFGQGITVTALQMVTAVNALANGGKLMQPYIVEELRYPNGEVVKNKPQVIRQVVSPQTASQIGAMMVSVVDNGQAQKAAVKGYYIAGKTGTAQVAENGQYGSKTVHSFIGFGPVSNPKFTVILKLRNPSKVQFADSSTSPVFSELASFLVDYYHLAPER